MMTNSARVLDETLLFSGRFRLTRTRVEIEESDGSVLELNHEVYRYLPAAAVLLYDSARGVVLLVKQFRLGAFLADGALELIEVCAGMLDDDAPDVCARREAFEETGVRVARLDFAFESFMSPGGMTEKITCFTASYTAADRLGAGGGVDDDERIELVEMPFAEALAAIDLGVIRDAKTIALLYHARAKGLM
jgi:GDP-mannose pyrophosphatase NudK